jgi:aminoglycoside N3'-acetyltransferase
MAISTFHYGAMVEHLRRLGVERGMEIVVHSSLLAFGKLPEKAKTVLDAVWEVIGPDGSIAVPTFTFDLDPVQPFVPTSTAPRAMGALANFFWKLPEVRRTGSCTHSYAAMGEVAKFLDEVRYDISFGPGSFFDLAVKRDMYWVMLGCDINSGCTLIHHSEAVASVPYREWLDLPRRVKLADGMVRDFAYRYFARRTDEFAQNFEVLKDAMLAAGRMKVVPAPYGASLAGSSAAIHGIAMELIQHNPQALVKVIAS